MYGYVAHTCILFKLKCMCVQANMATRVQASSVSLLISTRLSHSCCIELVANLYHTLYILTDSYMVPRSNGEEIESHKYIPYVLNNMTLLARVLTKACVLLNFSCALARSCR